MLSLWMSPDNRCLCPIPSNELSYELMCLTIHSYISISVCLRILSYQHISSERPKVVVCRKEERKCQRSCDVRLQSRGSKVTQAESSWVTTWAVELRGEGGAVKKSHWAELGSWQSTASPPPRRKGGPRFISYFKLSTCVCVHVQIHISAGVSRCQKRMLDSQDVELLVVVCCLMEHWELSTGRHPWWLSHLSNPGSPILNKNLDLPLTLNNMCYLALWHSECGWCESRGYCSY